MRATATILLGALSTAMLSTACAKRTVVVNSPPQQSRVATSTAATLRIPPGHLPPPGRCRIWIRGQPPGHQAKARSCQRIAAIAPAGAWILYRPSADKKVVHVREVDSRRDGIVVLIRVYEAASGKLLREEKPKATSLKIRTPYPPLPLP